MAREGADVEVDEDAKPEPVVAAPAAVVEEESADAPESTEEA
jgi:hypothetical protein